MAVVDNMALQCVRRTAGTGGCAERQDLPLKGCWRLIHLQVTPQEPE